MKPVFALFLVLTVALIGIAPSVSLAEYPSNYVVSGELLASDDFDLQGQHFNRDDGFVAGDRVRALLHADVRLELGAGYFESKASAACAVKQSSRSSR